MHSETEEESEQPIGANELRIVRGIEDSIKNSRGPRIQVVKSRDIKNAEHFAEKVFRVLKMHGFKIVNLSVEELRKNPQEITAGENTIFSINEATIKNYLGSNLNTSGRPMQYLFDNSMLSYLRKPVLISVVSDAFYDKVGLQKFVQYENSQGKTRVAKRGVEKKSGVNRFTLYSFYLAAVSFALSGLNSLFGSYLQFQGTYNLLVVPLALLILSLSAITLRAFSLGQEDHKSLAPVSIALVLFLFTLILGLITTSYGLSLARVFLNTVNVIFSLNSDLTLLALAYTVMALSLIRYILFLGANSGGRAYALSAAGLVLFVLVILMTNFPAVTIFGQTVLSLNGGVAPYATLSAYGFGFSPEIPIFGISSYFQVSGTPQYLLLRNYLLFIANIILSLSYFTAARRQKHISSEKNKV